MVADGAGSAKHGDVGSRLVVEYARFWATERRQSLARTSRPAAWAQRFRELLSGARGVLVDEASRRGVDVRELATTAIVVVVRRNVVAAAQIGDGASVINDADGRFDLLTQPSNGEFANETTFLTSDDALQHLQVRVKERAIDTVAVLTDGMQTLALDMRAMAPHAGFFHPFFRLLDQAPAERVEHAIRDFLGSERVRARTDDDVTLALACRRPTDAAVPHIEESTREQ